MLISLDIRNTPSVRNDYRLLNNDAPVASVLSNMRFFFSGKLHSQLTFKRLSFRPSFASIRPLSQTGADLHPFCPIFGRDLHPNMTKIGADLHQFGSCPKSAPICIISARFSAPICVDSLDRIYIDLAARIFFHENFIFLAVEALVSRNPPPNCVIYSQTLLLMGTGRTWCRS